MNEKDIFKNYSEKEITNLIFDGLRKKYGESLKDNLFEEEEIRPNGNFRFATDGLVYAYNEYEIAPYTMGLIETVLPYSQINPLLKNEYKKTE
ncbi:MAG: RsiV family protein [Dysgonomonas sp.]